MSWQSDHVWQNCVGCGLIAMDLYCHECREDNFPPKVEVSTFLASLYKAQFEKFVTAKEKKK